MEQVEKMISKPEIAQSILMTLRPASWKLILCSVRELVSESSAPSLFPLLAESPVIHCRRKTERCYEWVLALPFVLLPGICVFN